MPTGFTGETNQVVRIKFKFSKCRYLVTQKYKGEGEAGYSAKCLEMCN